MKCEACEGGIPPLKGEKLQQYTTSVQGWDVVDGHHIIKSYTFKDFATALKFVNKLGAIAEEQGHHPTITFTWGKVKVKIWTHAIDGLTENDFILAAKYDQVEV